MFLSAVGLQGGGSSNTQFISGGTGKPSMTNVRAGDLAVFHAYSANATEDVTIGAATVTLSSYKIDGGGQHGLRGQRVLTDADIAAGWSSAAFFYVAIYRGVSSTLALATDTKGVGGDSIASPAYAPTGASRGIVALCSLGGTPPSGFTSRANGIADRLIPHSAGAAGTWTGVGASAGTSAIVELR